MTRLTALILALLVCSTAHAALRSTGTGQSTPHPTNPTPTPDTHPVSWQPPFTIFR